MTKCFIIMPISTPEDRLKDYSNDKDHFTHVLNHLFIPAIEKVGFEPKSPVTKGSELIQGEIIKNLEEFDLVLCDISCLNPNVFFELGIRTALNRPVSLVRDNITPDIPFDTNVINHHKYDCRLDPWILRKEIPKLADHIKASYNENEKLNSLYKYFSLSAEAKPLKVEGGLDDKFDYLSLQVDALRTELQNISSGVKLRDEVVYRDFYSEEDMKSIYNIAENFGLNPNQMAHGIGKVLHLSLKGKPPEGRLNMLRSYAKGKDIDLEVTYEVDEV